MLNDKTFAQIKMCSLSFLAKVLNTLERRHGTVTDEQKVNFVNEIENLKSDDKIEDKKLLGFCFVLRIKPQKADDLPKIH